MLLTHTAIIVFANGMAQHRYQTTFALPVALAHLKSQSLWYFRLWTRFRQTVVLDPPLRPSWHGVHSQYLTETYKLDRKSIYIGQKAPTTLVSRLVSKRYGTIALYAATLWEPLATELAASSHPSPTQYTPDRKAVRSTDVVNMDSEMTHNESK